MAKKRTNTRTLELYLFQLDNKDLQAVYKWAYEELMRELEHFLFLNPEELTRTQIYRWNKLTELIEKLKVKTNQIITDRLDDVCTTVNKEVSTVDWNLFTDMQAEAIVKADFLGQTYSARIWQNLDAIKARIEKDMIRLVIGGEYPHKLEEALMKDFNVGYMEANRLIRTEANRVFNSAALNTYISEGVTRFGIDVTEDERLCESCKEFIDKEFTIDALPLLPDHPNCRCVYYALD